MPVRVRRETDRGDAARRRGAEGGTEDRVRREEHARDERRRGESVSGARAEGGVVVLDIADCGLRIAD